MLLFNRPAKFFVVALASIFLLAGCTFQPVYNDNAQEKLSIEYAKPSSVVEQTIIQELAFKLGRASGAAKYALSLSTTTSTRNIFKVGSTFPRSEYEATVRTSFVLIQTETGEQILADARFATAIYQNSTQNIANNTAQADAYQRAAKDVARQIELLIVAAINENQP